MRRSRARTPLLFFGEQQDASADDPIGIRALLNDRLARGRKESFRARNGVLGEFLIRDDDVRPPIGAARPQPCHDLFHCDGVSQR